MYSHASFKRVRCIDLDAGNDLSIAFLYTLQFSEKIPATVEGMREASWIKYRLTRILIWLPHDSSPRFACGKEEGSLHEPLVSDARRRGTDGKHIAPKAQVEFALAAWEGLAAPHVALHGACSSVALTCYPREAPPLG